MNITIPAYNYQSSDCVLSQHGYNPSQESIKIAYIEAIKENKGNMKLYNWSFRWYMAKRGHTFHNGVVSATSFDTDKIFDEECY